MTTPRPSSMATTSERNVMIQQGESSTKPSEDDAFYDIPEEINQIPSRYSSNSSPSLPTSVSPTPSTRSRVSPYSIVPSMFLFMMSVSIAIVPLQQWLLLYICKMTRPDTMQSASMPLGGKMEVDAGLLWRLSQSFPGLFRNSDSRTFTISNHDWESCRADPHIQAVTARWNMILSLSTSIPALFSSPIIGIMSDYWGRKPMLYIPVVCTIIGMSSLLIVSWLHVGLWFLVFTHFIQGIMGSWPVMLTGTLAFIADTTDPGLRSSVFVFVEAIIFCAFALGPVIGGYLSRLWSENGENVFVLSVICLLCVLVYILIFVPESLHSKHEQADSPADSPPNPSLTISNKIKKAFLNSMGLFQAASNVSVLLVLFAIMASTASFSGRGQNFYYAAFKFGWDALDEGQYMLVGSISRIFHMLVMFPFLNWMFSSSTANATQRVKFELDIIRGGMLCSAIGTTAMALAEKPWIWYASTAIDGFGMLSSPTVRSVLSKCIASTHQGQLLASIQFVEQAVGLVFGIIFPTIWAKTVGTSMPNLFLWVIVVLYLTAFVAVFFARETQLDGSQYTSKDEGTTESPTNSELETSALLGSAAESSNEESAPGRLKTYGSSENLQDHQLLTRSGSDLTI